jgi:hypothetical protein
MLAAAGRMPAASCRSSKARVIEPPALRRVGRSRITAVPARGSEMYRAAALVCDLRGDDQSDRSITYRQLTFYLPKSNRRRSGGMVHSSLSSSRNSDLWLS